ncbi:hypothetical protein J2M53_09510 [Arthrobacter sp. zg-ZUI100]|uniref:alpha/beta fold hydrolase n=1 Tax=Arthrobacter jiangjiafuii TaxID=2817475 RepID=UPI001AEE4B65|nr:alpha/beta hydrolase [Arthrobacter jiangjiafuii]MBP3036489.1 hypothetical protein [Arthrobacter jiangjiafuii]
MLYSETAGEGLPILLLHGGFCSLESLRAQSDALVAERRVYAFERPGHGRSADIDGGYSYERSIADTLAHADLVLAKLVRLWTEEPRINPAVLSAITATTLVISGDRDTIRPDHSLLIAASIPGAQLCILPGATHGLVAEHPELISAVVREWPK